jgi:hypothetical protein
MDNLAAPMRRSRALAIATLVLLLITIVLAVAAFRLRKSPVQKAMESLAQFVLNTVKTTLVPVEPLKHFGVPTDDLNFYQLRATSETGRMKAIQVRQRKDSGVIDIFLLDLRPTYAGRFYLTGTHGHLMKAAFFDTQAEPIDGAQERFEHELEFWLMWQREKLKLLP